MRIFSIFFLMVIGLNSVGQDYTKEIYRPLFHFSPRAHWMNDPNGLVYHNGTYHMFFQYYPGGTTWGPMHWGHATSKNLLNWVEQPVALYPDSLGYIFSGSAVVDKNNTSGFGTAGKKPLVAIFTYHDSQGEQQKKTDYQTQGIAYSLDEGKTWSKYKGNPVLKNPGIIDFRDPKVMWYEPQKKWLMTLATKDRITFYSSPDLKHWSKQSEFGQLVGAHGGVWECPDLLQFDHNGKRVWVLLVSINPGAPNGGSGTQYFVGDFDGNKFTPVDSVQRWIDYGTDNYAGVTFSNTGSRKIFIGWMSNWQYGQVVPTEKWRSAMTIPRELSLVEFDGKLFLQSVPVKEFDAIKAPGKTMHQTGTNSLNEIDLEEFNGLFSIDLTFQETDDFSLIFMDKDGKNQVEFGYSRQSNSFYADRSMAGKTDFEAGFGKIHFAPRISTSGQLLLTLIFDRASMEIFADGGATVMTEIFFMEKPISKLRLKTSKGAVIQDLQVRCLTPVRISC